MYTDNADEYRAAFRKLEWPADTCQPHRHETNGIAERAVQRVKEGASALLVQSGLDDQWWDLAVSCFCWHRVVVDKVTTGGAVIAADPPEPESSERPATDGTSRAGAQASTPAQGSATSGEDLLDVEAPAQPSGDRASSSTSRSAPVPTLCPLIEEGQTPYRQRFGEDYRGPLCSFGAKIQYKPSWHCGTSCTKSQRRSFSASCSVRTR